MDTQIVLMGSTKRTAQWKILNALKVFSVATNIIFTVFQCCGFAMDTLIAQMKWYVINVTFISNTVFRHSTYSNSDLQDEENCYFARNCPKGYFKCRNNHCILEKMHCNGVKNCGDNSDKANCPSGSSTITPSMFSFYSISEVNAFEMQLFVILRYRPFAFQF